MCPEGFRDSSLAVDGPSLGIDQRITRKNLASNLRPGAICTNEQTALSTAAITESDDDPAFDVFMLLVLRSKFQDVTQIEALYFTQDASINAPRLSSGFAWGWLSTSEESLCWMRGRGV